MPARAPRPAKPCHYCGERANTKDHIVPRVLLGHGLLDPSGGAIPNTVPACARCNQAKGAYRSTCACARCVDAWLWYGPRRAVRVVAVPPAAAELAS